MLWQGIIKQYAITVHYLKPDVICLRDASIHIHDTIVVISETPLIHIHEVSPAVPNKDP